MAHKIMDAQTAVGVSGVIRTSALGIDALHTMTTRFRSLAATKISACVIKLQGSYTKADAETGVIDNPTLAVGSTTDRVANAAFNYRIANVNYTQAAEAAGEEFTVAHTIAASKYGIILMYVNAAGTISSLVPGASQTDAQSYDTAALAHAAGDTILTVPGTLLIGRILILNDAGLWTANTDDMTNASDVVTATFLSEISSFVTLVTNTFSADELIAQISTAHAVNKGHRFIRHYLSTLTGEGEVDSRHEFMRS